MTLKQLSKHQGITKGTMTGMGHQWHLYLVASSLGVVGVGKHP